MSIAKKIAQIIAKAESTDSVEEAATFMAKAHQLMEQHGITLLELGRLDADDPIGTTKQATKNSNTYGWQAKIAFPLARFYGCEFVTERTTKTTYHSVIGRESARITYQLMLPFVVGQVVKMANDAARKGLYSSASKARTAIGNALSYRLWVMVREQRRQQETAATARIRALVPVDRIQLEMEAAFPSLKFTKNRGGKTDAVGIGLAAGVSLNLQTTGGSAQQRIAG